jgi:hypothetical protein
LQQLQLLSLLLMPTVLLKLLLPLRLRLRLAPAILCGRLQTRASA